MNKKRKSTKNETDFGRLANPDEITQGGETTIQVILDRGQFNLNDVPTSFYIRND